MEQRGNVSERRRRLPTRLRGYDYSQAGACFVTVCTTGRELLLASDPVRDAVRAAWHSLPDRFPLVSLDEFVVMPNHVHGIIFLAETWPGAEKESTPTLSAVMRAFKSISAIAANRLLGRASLPFWQRGYYGHIIRNEADLNRIREYIRNNPLEWALDPENPAHA